MFTIREEVRPAMAVFAVRGVELGDWRRSTSTGGHSENRPVDGRAKDDHSGLTPRAPAGFGCGADHLNGTAGSFDPFKFAVGKEGNGAAVW